MNKTIFAVTILICAAVASNGHAEWVSLSNSLDELDIHVVAANPKDPKMIFAASEKTLYKTVDNGSTWKQALRLRAGDNRINFIRVDLKNPATIYVCTDRGLYRSMDNGVKWSLIFTGQSDGAKKVYCVARDQGESPTLWVGADRGLYQMNEKTLEVKKVNGLPDGAVFFIYLDAPKETGKVILTDHGIYKSSADLEKWEKVFTSQAIPETPPEGNTPLQQFGVEELNTAPLFSNLIFLKGENQFYAATKNGVLKGVDDASTWRSLEGQTLPVRQINGLEPSKETFYAATNRGVFQWNQLSHSFHEIYLGLESDEIRALCYNAAGDYLLAATKKGVYRLFNPEGMQLGAPANEMTTAQVRDIVGRFASEPTVLEIQNAAIQYAEVHPKKIEAWRKAASLKAWAPTISFHQNNSSNNNVNLDRGGTADPDRFITGPKDLSQDRYATVSWNVADIIYNSDQTSIDSRSKLMVELRNDVLNEVTHLYFERRRLQIEMLTIPMKDLPVNLEREIRLEELTASIDALTGGYLSKRLEKNQDRIVERKNLRR
ncbi:MAG: hypothetical protein AUJ72_05190 [Candidatus Omnitrophica bacterium CG1_02_46_14]|nr:MAG: hypothetical protein AUJ72_05190 [Candidatus Omnitrophica bacterium CG1_02_46_14]